jgi:MFS transporter, ACS family, D-galactonate transporter
MSIPLIIAPKGMVVYYWRFYDFHWKHILYSRTVVTGLIVGAIESFASVIVLAPVILLVGSLSFPFLLGEIKRTK